MRDRKRNLTVYGSYIYYERVVNGRRYRANTGARADGGRRDWDEAAAFRDLYEERKGINRKPLYTGRMPTFVEMAERYLAEDTGHLSTRVRYDRKRYLRHHRTPITARSRR